MLSIAAKVTCWVALAIVIDIVWLVLVKKFRSAARVTATVHSPAVRAVTVRSEMEHTVLPVTTEYVTTPVPLPAEPAGIDKVVVAGDGEGLYVSPEVAAATARAPCWA